MFPFRFPALIPARHIETLGDAYAIIIGCTLIALGLVLLRSAGLVTGGMAGVALALSFLVAAPIGVLFSLVNLPFFLLAQRKMGPRFTIKTVSASLMIAAIGLAARDALHLDNAEPLFCAIVGGTVIGMGMLALIRHRTGVGGIGVVTLWLEQRRGWKPGATQLGFDLVILLGALPLLDTKHFLCSVVSAVATNAVVLAWHRPDRLG